MVHTVFNGFDANNQPGNTAGTYQTYLNHQT